MVFSSILLYLAIVGMCWAGEPVCRQFDYDEKMLSEMIRTEIAVETMTTRLEVLESMLKERDERMQGSQIAEILRTSSIGDATPRSGFTATKPSALPDGGLALNTVLTNYGENFKASTGKFICETPGLYFFSATIMSGPLTSSPCYCWIKVGSAQKSLVHAHTKHIGDYPSGSGSLVYELKKDEEVYLGGCVNAVNFNPHTHFSGVLIK